MQTKTQKLGIYLDEYLYKTLLYLKEANEAFEALNYAQSINTQGGTTEEWKAVFGSSFNINEEA